MLCYCQSRYAEAMCWTPPGLLKVWVVAVTLLPPRLSGQDSSGRASTQTVYSAISSGGEVPAAREPCLFCSPSHRKVKDSPVACVVLQSYPEWKSSLTWSPSLTASQWPR